MFGRQQRQELEDRLHVIESKQRQLEVQDRLISGALSFMPRSVAELVTDGLTIASKSADELAHHVSDTRSGYYPVMSQQHGSTQMSTGTSITDARSSKPFSVLPSSSCSRVNTNEIVDSAVLFCNEPVVESSVQVAADRAKISADSVVDSNAARVREYQDELLRRQTDRQHALLEARRRLQMRAEQLLDSGVHLLSESPSNRHRAVSHVEPLTVPSEKSHMYKVKNNGISHLSCDDVLRVPSSDVLLTEVDVSKPYKPELYQPKSLPEDVEAFEYSVAAASPDNDDTGDERQFVTPELKEHGRVQPCRVAEYSPSPSPHANDTAFKSQQLSVSPGHSITQSNKDDFNALILQAQRDLEVRQRQMQEQLEALENEEQRLAEQHLRISSQLGSFPSKIQTFTSTTQSQQPTAVLNTYVSSSSDLLALAADGALPSLSAQNTLSVSRDASYRQLSASNESLDISELRPGQKCTVSVDNTSPRTELHQIHLSHSAPLLQGRNDGSCHVTSDHLLPPVSVILVIV